MLFLFGGIYTDSDVELESPLPWQVFCDEAAWPGLNQMGEKMGSQVLKGKIETRAIGDKSNQTKLFVGIEDSHTPGAGSAVARTVQLLTWYSRSLFPF